MSPTKHRWLLGGALALVALPTALLAQDNDGDISRSPEGTILHRRSPEPGDTPVPDTPVFVYEPGTSDRGVPKDLVRDGVSMPRPSGSTAPVDGELIHTAEGLAKPPPRTAEPLSRPPAPGARDPSAPLPPTPSPAPGESPSEPTGPAEAAPPTAADSDAVATDFDGAPTGAPIEGDGGASDPDAQPVSTNPDGPAGDSGDGSPGEDPRSGLGDEARPDRDTGREGTLHYNDVFDPSIVPFKRNRALDVVTEDYTLTVSDRRIDKVEPIGNRVERGREVFWGSLLIAGEGGRRVPIPSVSPEGQILSYQATPAQVVTFERDAAGNFYATPELDGTLRLVFVTDAPSHWFGRTLPASARFDYVPRALRPKLPRAIQKEAIEVAQAIGIPAGTGYREALERLVAWFRAFEPGEPPPTRGSIYRDITLGQKGICRHRGHGFVITAQALGIPARYVFNEAHVFVEVFIPGDDPGWLRIDLGGGADELQVHGAEGKSLHQPLTGDPFEKPPAFANSEAAGATRVEGMPAEPGSLEMAPGPTGDAAPLALEGPIVRARPAPHLEPTKTTITASGSLVFRGDALRLSGTVTTLRGAPIPDGTVQVLLARGPGKEAVALLGTATLEGGRFAVEVAIPARQDPGAYEIFAEYLGDGIYAPSVGE